MKIQCPRLHLCAKTDRSSLRAVAPSQDFHQAHWPYPMQQEKRESKKRPRIDKLPPGVSLTVSPHFPVCPTPQKDAISPLESSAEPESDELLSRWASPFSELTFPKPLLTWSPLDNSVFSGVVGLLWVWLCFNRLNLGDPAVAWITGDWGLDWIGFSSSLASCN